MSPLPVCVVLLSCALIKGCTGAIQCYTCDDCRVVNDTLLQLCPADVGTVAPSAEAEELPTTSAPETTAVADDAEPVAEEGEGDGAEPVEPEPAEADPGEDEPAEAGAVEAEEPEPESESLVVSPDILSNLNITRRKRESPTGPISYHCFSAQHVDDGGPAKTKRGCIAVVANDSACAILKETYGVSEKTCKICARDKCNAGVVVRHSLAAALLVVVNSLIQW